MLWYRTLHHKNPFFFVKMAESSRPKVLRCVYLNESISLCLTTFFSYLIFKIIELFQREKVAVARFVPPELKPDSDDESKAVGSGIPLGDIEHIKESIEKKKSDDDVLTKLHLLCFGKTGQKASRKKNLRLFNGFANTGDAEAKVE